MSTATALGYATSTPTVPLALIGGVGAACWALASRHHRIQSRPTPAEPLEVADVDDPPASVIAYRCEMCGRAVRRPVWALSHVWLCDRCEDIVPASEAVGA